MQFIRKTVLIIILPICFFQARPLSGQHSMTLTGEKDTIWKKQENSVSRYLTSVHFIDRKTGWVVGWNGVILHTSDSGKNWQIQESGVENHLYTVQFVDRKTGWVAGRDGVILHTDDGGITWRTQDSGTAVTLGHPDYGRSLNFIDSNHGWITGANGTILNTKDGGNTWQKQESGVSESLFSVHFVDEKTGWIGGNDGILLYTTDGGENWKERYADPGSFITCIYFMDSDTGWILKAFDLPDGIGNLLRTTDGGESWETHHLIIRHYSLHFTDTQTGWMVKPYTDYKQEVAWHTTDGGLNWNLQTGDKEYAQVKSVYMSDSYTGWAVGSEIMHYANEPALPAPALVSPVGNDTIINQPVRLQWEEVGPAESYRLQISSSYSFNTRERDVYGITTTTMDIDGLEDGRTYYWRVISNNEEGSSYWSEVHSFTTGRATSIEEYDELPVKVILHSNYPNPFNPVTVITYELPVESEVLLEVYDILGLRVAVLVDQTKAPGRHQATWDATDVASGTYIYRLRAGEAVKSRKLMHIK